MNVRVIINYRCFYSPNHFKHAKSWKLLNNIEMSTAIKIPNVATQLVGFKKFQQILANNTSILSEYLKKATEVYSELSKFPVELLTSTFATFHSLDQSETDVDEIMRLVKKNTESFVLKPQREGGGNNFYGKQMIGVMQEKHKAGLLSQFIVMSLIRPSATPNFKVLDDHENPHLFNCITELGIYGSYIVDGNNKLVLNENEGHLLRSKDISTKDGGVFAGNALLDSPILL